MTRIGNAMESRVVRFAEAWRAVRRAFSEFLRVPTSIIGCFLLLSVASTAVDRIDWGSPARAREFLRRHVFGSAEATSELLGAIAGSILTISGLTITLLLIVIQQTAASLSNQVFDQFLRRRSNQIYFGFFLGLALYSLVILATVNEPFNPVYGAALALFFTIVALLLLMVLIYTTINQMRPVVVIGAIHDQILGAREKQRSLIDATLRAPRRASAAAVSAPIKCEQDGFVTNIDVAGLKAALADAGDEAEILLQVSIGDFVAFGDVLALVHGADCRCAQAVAEAIRDALLIEHQRDIRTDPGYGIEQLETIAWTSISTAKSNPSPGRQVIRTLRDVLARWSDQTDRSDDAAPMAVVYADNVPAQLLDVFETLAVSSSESMQHRNFIEVLRAFVIMFDRLPRDQQRRVEDIVLRILPALGDLVLTAGLGIVLGELAAVLDAAGRAETAGAVRAAHEKFERSLGKLGSRANRATN